MISGAKTFDSHLSSSPNARYLKNRIMKDLTADEVLTS
jgi:hypothetical protein